MKSRPVEIGYEVRCVQPIAFDMLYCALMGIGVKHLFDQGLTSCMVVSGPNGDITPLYLKDVEDENGKTRAHLRTVTVDALHGDSVIISSGLEPGERIAASGAFKLREAALVALAQPSSGGGRLAGGK